MYLVNLLEVYMVNPDPASTIQDHVRYVVFRVGSHRLLQVQRSSLPCRVEVVLRTNAAFQTLRREKQMRTHTHTHQKKRKKTHNALNQNLQTKAAQRIPTKPFFRFASEHTYEEVEFVNRGSCLPTCCNVGFAGTTPSRNGTLSLRCYIFPPGGADSQS